MVEELSLAGHELFEATCNCGWRRPLRATQYYRSRDDAEIEDKAHNHTCPVRKLEGRFAALRRAQQ